MDLLTNLQDLEFQLNAKQLFFTHTAAHSSCAVTQKSGNFPLQAPVVQAVVEAKEICAC